MVVVRYGERIDLGETTAQAYSRALYTLIQKYGGVVLTFGTLVVIIRKTGLKMGFIGFLGPTLLYLSLSVPPGQG